ncbi:MAG: lamin tail domain-containing protein [Candidatus Latescibacterota bacterium]|nr:MAG: lamin tail domain-containing protein [Candidatus Latescibacterota bacterium]
MAAALSALVVNEVLYDPPGADAGREFVEILNVSGSAVALEGVEIQAGDGARATWRTAWRGFSGVIEPGELLLVAGDSVAARHATLQGSLQNGPDAVRLWDGTAPLDLVGYGALTQPQLYEGRPAADVTGTSLARVPDGHDSNDNAADLRSALPTPGRRNVARRAWRLALVPPDPTRVWPQRRVHVQARVHNSGIEALEAGAWQPHAELVRLVGEPYRDAVLRDAPRLVDVVAPRAALAPGDSVEIDVGWSVELGLYELVVSARGADEDSSDNEALLLLRSGPGPVLIDEILFAPRPGEPEWLELRNRDTRAHDLDGWTLADARGRRAFLRATAPLPPHSLALASADTSAPIPGASDSVLRVGVAPWPSLNNSDGDAGWADQVVLRDPRGIVQDALFYRASWGGGRGRSIERLTEDPDARGLLWSVSKDPSGSTPGRPNSASAPPSAHVELHLEPNPFSPNQDGDSDLVGIAFHVPSGFRGFRLSVFDTGGRRRRTVAADRLGPGPRRLVWDGADDAGNIMTTGAYIVHLELIGGSGGARAVKRVVGLVRP